MSEFSMVLALLFALLVPTLSWGFIIEPYSFGESFASFDFSVRAYPPQHVSPNEQDPRHIKFLLEKSAQEGIYFTAGTERGFIAASLLPSINGLIFGDRGPYVVLYDEINIALLTVARNRKHYLQLRYKSSQQEWIGAISDDVSVRTREILSNKKVFSWWDGQIRGASDAAQPSGLTLLRHPGRGPGDPFFQANYLNDDVLFDRLSRLAKKERMQVFRMDYGDEPKVEVLVKSLLLQRERISVFDSSNIFTTKYLSLDEFARLLKQLSQVRTDKALLLMTKSIPGPRDAGPNRFEMKWGYFALPFEPDFDRLRLRGLYDSLELIVASLNDKTSDVRAANLIYRPDRNLFQYQVVSPCVYSP